MDSSQPIGIFDSGIGGLTIAHAVAKKLPHENIIYFGDTAHLPYGDKSAETIQRYCENIVDFLLRKNCKLILVACNSATAAAYDNIQKHIKNRALLVDVIQPTVKFVAEHFQGNTVGLIGTKQTIHSKVFETKLHALAADIRLKARATPLLTPVIEENFHHNEVLINTLLELYFQDGIFDDISSLILGCTHYPLIKTIIQRKFSEIALLDESDITANAVAEVLLQKNLLNPQKIVGKKQFFVSDLTPAFSTMANQFFGESLSLQTCFLGD